MQMMRPLRRRIMCGAAARVHRNVGRRFRRSTKSQSSTFISQILALRLPPTSFTWMSMSPKRLRALHEGPRAFVIANPWDAGSARVLAALGFQALATSSGAKAGVLGKRDGKVTRDESLANARMIVEATDLPVSADLEKCFGDAPAVVAETIRLPARGGLAGGSV